MPVYISKEDYTMLAAGATKTFDVSGFSSDYNLIPNGGAITLLGNIVINPTGTAVDGMKYVFHYGGGVTAGAFSVTIFGYTLTDDEALSKYTVECIYINSSWDVRLILSRDSSGTRSIDGANIIYSSIGSSQIAANAIILSKMAPLTARGYMYRAGAAGVVEEFDAKTSGAVLLGNGTDILSIVPTGDVTISSTGVTTIGDGKVTNKMLAYTPMEYLEVSRTFSSAEVLTLYSSNTNTGIELLAAPGVGNYIELISVTAYNNYASTTYSAGTNLLNLNVNAVALWTFPNAFIEATSDTVSQGTRVADAIIALNTGVKVQIAAADPTVGDGAITISAIYRIKTV